MVRWAVTVGTLTQVRGRCKGLSAARATVLADACAWLGDTVFTYIGWGYRCVFAQICANVDLGSEISGGWDATPE
jgi:hypothetical protein